MTSLGRLRIPSAAPWSLGAVGLLLLACSASNPPTDNNKKDAGSSDTNTSDTKREVPDPEVLDWPCQIEGDEVPDYLDKIGCYKDFEALSSEPMDSSIPGARSGKVVLDQLDVEDNEDGKLYFQNSQKYKIHFEFASANKTITKVKPVGTKGTFDETEYTTPDRRFVLGSVTYYEQPKVWALELAPYDTASAEQIEMLFNAVKAKSYFGPALTFHPTSDAIGKVAAKLPTSVPIKTTNDLFADINYQPLNLGETIGHVKILKAAELATAYVSYRDIVVLDEVPNDISVVGGLITAQFQTPLSHVNVLAQNRGTPNMGLRNATTEAKFVALAKDSSKWAKLRVGAFEWSIEAATDSEQAAWWDKNKPEPVTLPAPDLTVTELRDIEEVTEQTDKAPYATRDALKAACQAFGAKSANYSVLATDPDVPHKKAFGIPVYFYDQFMKDNGFYDFIRNARKEDKFNNDPAYREAKLDELRTNMHSAPVNEELIEKLRAKVDADEDFKGHSIRFRSSTNAEDLDGFPCAGCYDSHTGDPADTNGDQMGAMLNAVRKTWATAWKFRTYEEREYHSIDHTTVAMGLLVHTNFPEEEANGVAVTANPFDPSGNSPGFYINVQKGGQFEVVAPPPGVTSDSFIYEYDFPGTPIIYLTHSSILAEDEEHVLTNDQVHKLGAALKAIHDRFAGAYQPEDKTAWYAMDVEFKFDDQLNPGTPELYIKQARPYRGRGN